MASYSDSPYPLPERHRAELESIEAELDEIWPGWERRIMTRRSRGESGMVSTRFAGLKGQPYSPAGRMKRGQQPLSSAHFKRLKWVLKRHMLIMSAHPGGASICHALDEGGRPSCEWDIQMVSHKGVWISQPNPIQPLGYSETPERVDAVSEVLVVRQADAVALAFNMGLDLRTVKTALAAMPRGSDPESWVKQWRER